jgi:salicylate hydroxylase
MSISGKFRTHIALCSTNRILRIGEKRHVMAYQITAGESFNMVLSHIDDSDPATWATEKFTKELVQREFSGWDSW